MRGPGRYGHMRFPALIAGASLLLAACGSAPSSSADSVDETAPPSTTPVTKVPRTTVPTTDATPPPTTEPGTDPNAIDPATQPEEGGPFALADALLPDDALPPPWEFQRRTADRVGYGAGPNQTTCPAYWGFESALGSDGAHAMWWRDGGNADHHVILMADEADVVALAMDLYELPDTCPVVKWLEGGSFTTQRIDLQDGLGLRFQDEGSGDVTFVVLTANDRLLSVLHMPLWTATDGTPPEMSGEELSRLATQMYERTRLVDLTQAPGTAPATTLPPKSTPAPTTEAPRPPATTEPPVEPSGLALLLLTDDDLPQGWWVSDVSPYTPVGSDDPFVEACPAAESIDRVDAVFEWEADFFAGAPDSASELIGDLGDAELAATTVEEFGRIADCDLSQLMDGSTGLSWSGGIEDVPGADVAARLSVEISDGVEARFDLVMVSVGSIVAVVSIEATSGDEQPILDLAQRAAKKIAAAG